MTSLTLLAGRTESQTNLMNSKSLGLEVLIRIISISNDKEVDIKYINPKFE